MDKSPKKTTRRRLYILASLFAFAILILGFLVSESDPGKSWIQEFFRTMPGFLFGAMGFLILINQPRQLIGWLFLAYPLYFLLDLSLLLFVGPVSEFSSTLTPKQSVYVWFDSWAFLLIILPIFALGFIFPTGSFISEKWKRVPILFAMTIIASNLYSFFSKSWEAFDRSWPNPYAVWPDSVLNMLGGIAALGFLSIILLSIASLYIRFRGAKAEERTQLLWVFYAIAFLVINVLVAILFDPSGIFDLIFEILFGLAIISIPLSVMIAILRFRLWDIDVVINRALVYGGLSATLAGIFSGSVVLINQTTRNVVGQESSTIAALISTVFVASVFQPIKERIEDLIEERISPDSRDIRKDFVELEPAIRGEINIKQFAKILANRLITLLSVRQIAIFLANKDKRLTRWMASPENAKGIQTPKLSAEDWQLLAKGLTITGSGEFILLVPVNVPRLEANEVMGLIAIGPRESGRGFSSDSKKSLAKLGKDFGRALHLAELRRLDRG